MSGRQDGKASSAVKVKASARTGEKKGGKPRVSDIGRALRTVYDDTVREDVPDDLKDLLGRLT